MNVQEFINMIDANVDNFAPLISKVTWINEVNQYVYRNLIREYVENEYSLTAEDAFCPIDEVFEDIEKVIVNGTEYKQALRTNHGPLTYYKVSGGLAIDPVPDADGGLVAISRKLPEPVVTEYLEDQELALCNDFGEQFIQIYEMYCYAKLMILRDEPGKANNYSALYNEAVAALAAWYMKAQPHYVAEQRTRSWRRSL